MKLKLTIIAWQDRKLGFIDFLVIVLENELLYSYTFPMSDEALKNDFMVPIGKAKIEREGTDITLISYSYGLVATMKAAEELAKEGISAEVVHFSKFFQVSFDRWYQFIKVV